MTERLWTWIATLVLMSAIWLSLTRGAKSIPIARFVSTDYLIFYGLIVALVGIGWFHGRGAPEIRIAQSKSHPKGDGFRLARRAGDAPPDLIKFQSIPDLCSQIDLRFPTSREDQTLIVRLDKVIGPNITLGLSMPLEVTIHRVSVGKDYSFTFESQRGRGWGGSLRNAVRNFMEGVQKYYDGNAGLAADGKHPSRQVDHLYEHSVKIMAEVNDIGEWSPRRW